MASLSNARLYEYKPLGLGQIRLLRLQPSSDPDAPLHGDLIITNLDDLPPPRAPNSHAPDAPPDPSRYVCFDAVSYCWGAASLTDRLVTPDGSLSITTSLASVLRRLRPVDDHHAALLLWADAVCINQAHAPEKEHQVGLMGTIYAAAVRVVCDLGEGCPDDDLVLDAMERYSRRNIRRGVPLGQHDWPLLPGPVAAAIMGVDLPSEAEAAAVPEVEHGVLSGPFHRLLGSPWFRRLWVVQEFVLGRDAVMLLGRRRLAWGALWAGMVAYYGVVWPFGADSGIDVASTVNALLPYQSMCMIRASRLAEPATAHGRTYIALMRELNGGADMAHVIDLPLCLMGFFASGVTIPRDRYFAILGLLGPDRPADLRPDYVSPIEHITMRFWRAAYRRPTGADLLNFAGLSSRSPKYPTWIRDITETSYLDDAWYVGPAIEAAHAAGGRGSFLARFSDDDPGRMFLRAYRLDDVADILPTLENEAYDLDTLVVRMRSTFTFFASRGNTVDCPADLRYPPTGEHMHEAAWKTMANHNKNDTKPELAEKFETIFKLAVILPLMTVSDVLEHETIADEETLGLLAERFFTMWGMRFCKTRRGYFAALKQDVQVGDSIWIIAGSRLPAVLRPSRSHPGCFDFLGGGYVHGMMNEEAMQLPDFQWTGLSLR